MIPLLGGAFLAGLTGSPHCVGMCGGFASAATAKGGGLLWHAGRLTTYGALGALAGSFGSVLPGPGFVGTAVAGALLAWFALRLAGVVGAAPGFAPAGFIRVASRFAARSGPVAAFTFGLLSGLLPCGLVYTAMALPVAAPSPAAGALVMVVFGLGTVPALASARAALGWLAGRGPRLRRSVAAAVFILGMGALLLRSGAFSPDSADATVPPCHAHAS